MKFSIISSPAPVMIKLQYHHFTTASEIMGDSNNGWLHQKKKIIHCKPNSIIQEYYDILSNNKPKSDRTSRSKHQLIGSTKKEHVKIKPKTSM